MQTKQVIVKNRLKARRNELNFSQSKVAAKSDISPRCYACVERSQTIPNLFTALKIAKALRISVHKLFALKGDKFRE